MRPTILLLVLQWVSPFFHRTQSVVQAIAPPTVTTPPPEAQPTLSQMPLSFERNDGQTDARVQFTARGQGYQLFLTPPEAILGLGKTALRMKLVGANAAPKIAGEDQLTTVSNYYLGNDPSKFRTGVPHFAKVKYDDVYPGIDLVYYGKDQQMEYDFIVAPNVDPNVIKMNFSGANSLALDANGDLLIATKGGVLRQHKPVLYQVINGTRQTVAGSFVIHQNQVRFAIGDYDRTHELVIDPTLNYSTYLGGYEGDEKGYAIALDGSSNAFLTGEVGSASFPDVGITGSSSGGQDIFVAKLNSGGTGVSFYTFIGGSGDESGQGIALDSSGNVFVAGAFGTTSFAPGVSGYVTSDPSTTTDDAFVLKLNSSGALQNFTYLGGNGLDKANGIAVDSSSNVFVVGQTASSNFPTASAYDSTSNGQADVFVAKLNSSLGTLSYSTYIGGSNNDYGTALALQSSYIYLTGYTQSSGFPTNSAFDNTITGSAPVDAIVVKLDPSAGTSGLTYSTFLGGNGREEGRGIAVNSSGEAFVTGRAHSAGQDISDTGDPNYPYTASSTTFPLTSSAYQETQAGGGDVFVTRLNSSGNGLTYSTLLGGGDADTGYAIALDGNVAYVTGETDSGTCSGCTAFPTKNNSGLQNDQTGTDAFVSRLSPAPR